MHNELNAIILIAIKNNSNIEVKNLKWITSDIPVIYWKQWLNVDQNIK